MTRILGTAIEIRTDLCQSASHYRFLAAVMGIYPIFQMGEGVFVENKNAHFVVFASKGTLRCVGPLVGQSSFGLSVRHTLLLGNHVRIDQT